QISVHWSNFGTLWNEMDVQLKNLQKHDAIIIQLLDPVSLTLECTWTGNQKKLTNITGYWTKDGEEIPGTRLPVQLENEQYNLRRDFSISNEENLGNYSCVFGNEAKIDFILAAPQISEMRDKPVVSYLGDFVVIHCKMEETKPKPNTWVWYKVNGTEKVSCSAPVILLKSKQTLFNLSDADSGLYYCGAVYPISTSLSHVELKVISIIEPLKPFLTILAEVLFLVTIILLYERTHCLQKVSLSCQCIINGLNQHTHTQKDLSGPL
uniref:Embigin n=1 Tax=Amphilophus citrinellus TaxID=61819 RepID=A0A3Q0TGK1_AMPCI